MLVIRQNQVDALLEARQREHRGKVIELLRERMPADVSRYSDQELDAIVRDAVDRSGRYGLNTGESFFRFLALILLIHPQFDQEPVVQQYLMRADLSADEKLGELTGAIASLLETQTAVKDK